MRSAPIRYAVEEKWETSWELEMRPVTVSRTHRKSVGSAESAERVEGVESGWVWAIRLQREQGCSPSKVFFNPSPNPDSWE